MASSSSTHSPHQTTESGDAKANESELGIRVNKFISESGFCPRKKADRLIKEDRVTINGELCRLGTKVFPEDVVLIDGVKVESRTLTDFKHVYIVYNKPIGVTCTAAPEVENNIIDAIGHKERIFPIGRLDKPSEGLILLTTDGDIVNKILRAENTHDKEYLVTVDKPIDEQFAERMSEGIPILNTVTKPCKVRVESSHVFNIVLNQGLNRQIRRMSKYLGYTVTKLLRTRIMNIDLTGLEPNQWRDLTEQELAEIRGAIKDSANA